MIGEACGKAPVLDRQPMQPGDVVITYADVSKARERLGYDHTGGGGPACFVPWYRETVLEETAALLTALPRLFPRRPVPS